MPQSTVDLVQRAFGSEWEVVNVAAVTSSDGDGGGGSRAARQAARGAEVYLGWGVPRGVAAAASSTLRWAHTAAAGAGGSVTQELLASGAVLTNSRGVYAEPIADWVVAAVGFCLRGFHWAAAGQRDARWAKDEFTDGSVPLREFARCRVGIVGLGSIGRTVAVRCARLGMEVNAVRRRTGGRRPRGVRWVGGRDDLVELARQSEVLVLAAPRTRETDGMVDATVLDALPHRAFVINLARGALMDEDALAQRLDDGKIAGCVLDVFGEEPLPAGHPFWGHPRVFITPHVSGVSDQFWERERALIVDNIERYLSGRRLKNVVDLEVGY